MINLYSLDSKSFKIEDSILQRQFDAYISRFNDLILKNIKTGYRINLGDLSEITVDSQIATLENVKQLIYNFSCNCTTTPVSPAYKIFDYTFDKTFI